MDVNRYLMRLVETLKERGDPHPLEQMITPAEILSLRVDGGLRATEQSPLGMACTTLLATLESEGIPDPLHQPFTLGMIWLDLCRLADELPSAEVEALLDMTAAWPLSDVFARTGHVRPRVAVSGNTATMPEKDGRRW